MFRWLAICLVLCAGAVVLITLSVGRNPKTVFWDDWKAEEPNDQAGSGSPGAGDRPSPVATFVDGGHGPGARAIIQAIVVPDGRAQAVDKHEGATPRDRQ